MVKENFGRRVRELRTSAQISQDKFALAIGLDRTYLASVENGKRNISIENIDKIAKGLHITLSELFEGVK